MPEHYLDAAFEQRLERLLRVFADEGRQRFDAAEITRIAVHGRPRTARASPFPVWLKPALLAAVLLVSFAAVGVASGIIRLPTNDPAPNPTFVPFSPPPPYSPEPTLMPGSPDATELPTFVPGSPGASGEPQTFVPVETPTPPPTLEPTPSASPEVSPGPSESPVPTVAPSPSPEPEPTVAPLVAVREAAQGDLHSCALADDSRVFCWGVNDQGELGDGTTTSRFTADVPVVGIDDARAIATGIRFSCAILGDGSAWCWGEDPGSDGSNSVPVRVPQISDATAISAGGAFACALRAGGSVACWGNGQIGQLGNGVYENNSGVPDPQAVIGIDDAVSISSGWNHTCVVRSDRTIWCWGGNGDGATAYGSLGNGTLDQRSAVPVQVAGINDAVAVAAGGWSTCAIRADRSVWCWGYGERGTLGDGNSTNSATPVQVLGMSDAQTLALGRWHTCVSRGDDSVWCWGDIDWGGGGDKATPVEGFRSQDAVAMSTDRSLLVIDRDRVLWQWGFGSVNVPEHIPVGP